MHGHNLSPAQGQYDFFIFTHCFGDLVCKICALLLHKKRSFLLRISSGNVTKFTGNCTFGYSC